MPEAELALGFDYGKRRVGIAIGNAIAGTAKPLVTHAHIDGQPDWPRLDTLVAEWRPDIFVVGLPLNVDGATQKMTNRARNFADELWGRYRKRAHLVDERYSTIEARERLAAARASGSRGKRLAKGDSDAMAAQVILESWLQGTIHD
ncbi:Holliday junction resolvase RuvX [Salinisphaera sp. Q1T1-3]|uniref:Holliday junction resolvase RuvX n=1 Tax=Salinisphaera sp. Q1T1-3 TaxID=2321229 RepID=UPI000E750A90|nr:Holliday junction resolvase RuvX [Salinisphaera sp. Q1T1-3]RJS94911.1 Holliday junction resolvase RuvX [Salinisphaera sp. Q1T1-3]